MIEVTLIPPDASHDWDKKHQKATYSMANIVPQTPFANRYKFIALEKHEREMMSSMVV